MVTKKKRSKKRVVKRSSTGKKSSSLGPSDISNRTVLVLLIIVILVSVISLGVYLKALENAETNIENSKLDKGTLTINQDPNFVKEPTSSGGHVGLTIENPPGEKKK